MSDNPYQPYQQPNQQPNQQPYQSPNTQGDYQQPNYQQPNYQQPNYQQPNYQQPNYQQPNYQQPNYQQPNYQQPPYGYQQGYQNSAYPQAYQSAYKQPNKTQVLTIDFSLAGVLCYVPFFTVNLIASIIFLLTEPKSSFFVRFHAIQSLLLSLSAAVVGGMVALAWFFAIIMAAAEGSGATGAVSALIIFGTFLIAAILGLTIFILHFVGMYKSYNNEVWEMPIIGKYARRFSQSA